MGVPPPPRPVHNVTDLREGPLENLRGGRGAGKLQKNFFAQGEIKRKKIYSCYDLKKSYKVFDNEKNSCGSKIPLPPPPSITFQMVRPLAGPSSFLFIKKNSFHFDTNYHITPEQWKNNTQQWLFSFVRELVTRLSSCGMFNFLWENSLSDGTSIYKKELSHWAFYPIHRQRRQW